MFYVPSGGVLKLASGVGKRIEQDEYLLWMFHLTTSGTPQQTSAKLGVWFSRSEIEYQATTAMVTDRVLVDGQEVARDSGGPIIPDIPAGASQFTVTGVMAVRRPIILYSLWPHMHTRGRDMTFMVRDPKGHEETILSVPRFSFDWQFTYELATPMKIPAGSTIQAVADYDNSAANRNNPDPSQTVTWGPQATDEMFNPFLEIAPDRSLRPFVEFEHR